MKEKTKAVAMRAIDIIGNAMWGAALCLTLYTLYITIDIAAW